MHYKYFLKVLYGGFVDFGGATIYSLIQIASWYNLLQHLNITTKMVTETAFESNVWGLSGALLFSVIRKYIKTKMQNGSKNR